MPNETDHLITLEQVEKMFRRKKWRPLFYFLKVIITFTIITTVIFFILNAPAYLKKSSFSANPDQFNQLLSPKLQNNSDPVSQLVLPILYPTDLTDNTLFIPKISVKTPVTWNVPEDDILNQLVNGVAHYKSTALPGQVGNVFIFGHSSNYWWIKSDYNSIFALLDKVEIGDKIYLTYLGREYIYEITDKKVVSPDDVDVMNPTQNETISLMTCVPVGTSINRLVVTGTQISPKRGEQAVLVLPPTILPGS